MKNMPSEINICGSQYSIEYCKSPLDVDGQKRRALFGEIDYWTRKIRVYSQPQEIDVWKTLLHEIIHGVAEETKSCLNKEENHDDLDRLSIALADTLIRSNIVK